MIYSDYELVIQKKRIAHTRTTLGYVNFYSISPIPKNHPDRFLQEFEEEYTTITLKSNTIITIYDDKK